MGNSRTNARFTWGVAGAVLLAVAVVLVKADSQRRSADSGSSPLTRPVPSGASSESPVLEASAPPRREEPADIVLSVRAVLAPDGRPVASARIATRRGRGPWLALGEKLAPESFPFQIPAQGVTEIGIEGPEGAHWVGGVGTRSREMGVQLQAGLSIHGSVLSQDGHTPCRGAVVRILRGPAFLGVSRSVGDAHPVGATGEFTLSGLVPGSYEILADSPVATEGAEVTATLEAGDRDAVLTLGRQPVLTVRIVDSAGEMLRSGGGVEGVYGLARAGSNSLQPISLQTNPVILTPSEKSDTLSIVAFADGYAPSEPHQADWSREAGTREVDLVVRALPEGTAVVQLDLDFGGAAAPEWIHLSRRLTGSSVWAGETRRLRGGLLEVSLPVGPPVSLRLEPVGDGSVLASQRAFDATANPWLPRAVTVGPGTDRRVHVPFQQGGGLRIKTSVPGGRSLLGTLRRGSQRRRFVFRRAGNESQTWIPVSPPLPPGRWQLHLTGEAHSQPIPVDVVAGKVVAVSLSARKSR